MSTDTAFALGLLALVGPRSRPVARVHADRGDRRRHRRARRHRDRLQRGAEPGSCWSPLRASQAWVAARRLRIRRGPVCFALGLAAWVGSAELGGADRHRTRARTPCLRLPGPARNPGARDRAVSGSSASSRLRRPPRLAGVELRSATSTNERLQRLFHPWTSYVMSCRCSPSPTPASRSIQPSRACAVTRRSRSASSPATSSASPWGSSAGHGC